MDTWARREHYEYYTKQLKVEYNITANVDVKNVLDFCHSKGYKFYPAMIYLVTKTLNRIDNFKMFKDKYGYLCAWDKIIPNYTIFHNDDHTFSDCWTDFSEDFNIFYQDILKDMATAATKKELKQKKDNLLIFTAYPARHGQPLPVIAVGSLMANLLFPNCIDGKV